MEIFIDATNKIVGRMATFVAKRALLGDSINILNCDKAVITGAKDMLVRKYRHRAELTHMKGPYFPKMSDRFVRRIVRGMVPHKQKKGADAFRRVMCYIGVPENFKDKKFQQIAGTDVIERKVPKYVTISTICKLIGGKE
jgi:large subunit ribosomal protein L13